MGIGYDLGSGISVGGPNVGECGISLPYEPCGVDIGTDFILLLAGQQDSVDSGSWVMFRDAAQNYYSYVYNNSHNDGDQMTYKGYMDSGTYTCQVFGLTGTSHGILKIDMNAVNIVTWDQYSAVDTKNVYDTTTGITNSSGGLKDFTVRVAGKNASSSDHYVRISYIYFWRTS